MNRTILKSIATMLSAVLLYEAVATPLAEAAVTARPIQAFGSPRLPQSDFSSRIKISPFSHSPLKPLIFPISIGETTEFHQPLASSRIVYHLQDIHQLTPAQINLSEMISLLEKQAKLEGKALVVGVEGVAGEVDSDKISAVPDSHAKEAVGSGLLRSGFLFGEEYAAITHAPGRIKLVGVENPELYKQNGQARDASAQARTQILKTVKEIKAQLERLIPHNFNSALTALEMNRKKVEEGTLSTTDYIKFLDFVNSSIVSKYPGLARVRGVINRQDSIDHNKLESETERLLQDVVKNKSDKEVEALVKESQSLKENKISALSYYYKLLCQTQKNYPALQNYVTYLKGMEQIDTNSLFDEIQSAEMEMAKVLIKHPIAQGLYEHLRWIELQEKFFSLTMIPQEWDRQKNTDLKEILEHRQAIQDYVAEQVADLGYQFKTPVFSPPDLKVAVQGAKGFYTAAERRDQVMTENLNKILTKYPSDHYTVAFIAGGFHTRGITETLKNKGLGFAVVRPQLETQVKLNEAYTFPTDLREKFEQSLKNNSTENFFRAVGMLSVAGDAVRRAIQERNISALAPNTFREKFGSARRIWPWPRGLAAGVMATMVSLGSFASEKSDVAGSHPVLASLGLTLLIFSFTLGSMMWLFKRDRKRTGPPTALITVGFLLASGFSAFAADKSNLIKALSENLSPGLPAYAWVYPIVVLILSLWGWMRSMKKETIFEYVFLCGGLISFFFLFMGCIGGPKGYSSSDLFLVGKFIAVSIGILYLGSRLIIAIVNHRNRNGNSLFGGRKKNGPPAFITAGLLLESGVSAFARAGADQVGTSPENWGNGVLIWSSVVVILLAGLALLVAGYFDVVSSQDRKMERQRKSLEVRKFANGILLVEKRAERIREESRYRNQGGPTALITAGILFLAIEAMAAGRNSGQMMSSSFLSNLGFAYFILIALVIIAGWNLARLGKKRTSVFLSIGGLFGIIFMACLAFDGFPPGANRFNAVEYIIGGFVLLVQILLPVFYFVKKLRAKRALRLEANKLPAGVADLRKAAELNQGIVFKSLLWSTLLLSGASAMAGQSGQGHSVVQYFGGNLLLFLIGMWVVGFLQVAVVPAETSQEKSMSDMEAILHYRAKIANAEEVEKNKERLRYRIEQLTKKTKDFIEPLTQPWRKTDYALRNQLRDKNKDGKLYEEFSSAAIDLLKRAGPKPRLTVGIRGTRGGGKSTQAKRFVEDLHKSFPRRLVREVSVDDFRLERVNPSDPFAQYDIETFKKFMADLNHNRLSTAPIYDANTQTRLKFTLDQFGDITVSNGNLSMKIHTFNRHFTGISRGAPYFNQHQTYKLGDTPFEFRYVEKDVLRLTLKGSVFNFKLESQDTFLVVDDGAPIKLRQGEQIDAFQVFKPAEQHSQSEGEIVVVKGNLTLKSNEFDVTSNVNAGFPIRRRRLTKQELNQSQNDPAQAEKLLADINKRQFTVDLLIDEENARVTSNTGSDSKNNHLETSGLTLAEQIFRTHSYNELLIPGNLNYFLEEHGIKLDELGLALDELGEKVLVEWIEKVRAEHKDQGILFTHPAPFPGEPAMTEKESYERYWAGFKGGGFVTLSLGEFLLLKFLANSEDERGYLSDDVIQNIESLFERTNGIFINGQIVSLSEGLTGRLKYEALKPKEGNPTRFEKVQRQARVESALVLNQVPFIQGLLNQMVTGSAQEKKFDQGIKLITLFFQNQKTMWSRGILDRSPNMAQRYGIGVIHGKQAALCLAPGSLSLDDKGMEDMDWISQQHKLWVEGSATDDKAEGLDPKIESEYKKLPGYLELEGYQKQYIFNIYNGEDFLGLIPLEFRPFYIKMIKDEVPSFLSDMRRGFGDDWRKAIREGKQGLYRNAPVSSALIEDIQISHIEKLMAEYFLKKMGEELPVVFKNLSNRPASPQLVWAGLFDQSLPQDKNNGLFCLVDGFFRKLASNPLWLEEIRRSFNGNLPGAINAIRAEIDQLLQSEPRSKALIKKPWEDIVFGEFLSRTLELPSSWNEFDKAQASQKPIQLTEFDIRKLEWESMQVRERLTREGQLDQEKLASVWDYVAAKDKTGVFSSTENEPRIVGNFIIIPERFIRKNTADKISISFTSQVKVINGVSIKVDEMGLPRTAEELIRIAAWTFDRAKGEKFSSSHNKHTKEMNQIYLKKLNDKMNNKEFREEFVLANLDIFVEEFGKEFNREHASNSAEYRRSFGDKISNLLEKWIKQSREKDTEKRAVEKMKTLIEFMAAVPKELDSPDIERYDPPRQSALLKKLSVRKARKNIDWDVYSGKKVKRIFAGGNARRLELDKPAALLTPRDVFNYEWDKGGNLTIRLPEFPDVPVIDRYILQVIAGVTEIAQRNGWNVQTGLANQSFIIPTNSEFAPPIREHIRAMNYFGLPAHAFIFVEQASDHGFTFENGKFTDEYEGKKNTEAGPFGHGDIEYRHVLPNEAYFLDAEGNPIYLKTPLHRWLASHNKFLDHHQLSLNDAMTPGWDIDVDRLAIGLGAMADGRAGSVEFREDISGVKGGMLGIAKRFVNELVQFFGKPSGIFTVEKSQLWRSEGKAIESKLQAFASNSGVVIVNPRELEKVVKPENYPLIATVRGGKGKDYSIHPDEWSYWYFNLLEFLFFIPKNMREELKEKKHHALFMKYVETQNGKFINSVFYSLAKKYQNLINPGSVPAQAEISNAGARENSYQYYFPGWQRVLVILACMLFVSLPLLADGTGGPVAQVAPTLANYLLAALAFVVGSVTALLVSEVSVKRDVTFVDDVLSHTSILRGKWELTKNIQQIVKNVIRSFRDRILKAPVLIQVDLKGWFNQVSDAGGNFEKESQAFVQSLQGLKNQLKEMNPEAGVQSRVAIFSADVKLNSAGEKIQQLLLQANLNLQVQFVPAGQLSVQSSNGFDQTNTYILSPHPERFSGAQPIVIPDTAHLSLAVFALSSFFNGKTVLEVMLKALGDLKSGLINSQLAPELLTALAA